MRFYYILLISLKLHSCVYADILGRTNNIFTPMYLQNIHNFSLDLNIKKGEQHQIMLRELELL